MYSVSINGTTIESQIDGFVSGEVTGRLIPAIELSTITVGSRNGSLLKRKRIASRELKVSYAIIADTKVELFEKFNKLNEILSYEESTITFGDNPDVYYFGTLEKMDEPDGSKTTVSGYIYFLCSDPYKYTDETTIQPVIDDNGIPTFSVDYTGSAPSKPVIIANINADCGYLAFINARGDIIQIGDPDEEDIEQKVMSEVLVNSEFSASIPSSWVQATGNFVPKLSSRTVYQEGACFIRNGRLTVQSYGTHNGYLHGPFMKTTFEACTDVVFEAPYGFYKTSSSAQAGSIVFGLQNSEKYIAAVHISSQRNDANAKIEMWLNGTLVKSWSINVCASKLKDRGSVKIEKYGKTVTFSFGGSQKASFTFSDPNIEEAAVTSAYVGMLQSYYKSGSSYAAASFMGEIGITAAKIIKANVEVWEDVPNKLTAGDEIIVDTSQGLILQNGHPTHSLGALGNDWETFSLESGLNAIGCFYSEWTATPPTFEMRYRTVYL